MDTSFHQFGLDPSLERAVSELGFDTPTPVQSQTIPAVLAGRDVQASAQTGSGKTAAFALPLLHRTHQAAQARSEHGQGYGPKRLSVLILVPTRELAAQVGEVIRTLAQYTALRLKTVVAFGGVSINPQMMSLRGGADIVVATPGRLIDLLRHNALRLSELKTLVLDEADRLMDLGFADELAAILQEVPATRQTLLFSATFPDAVDNLARQLLKDPVRITVTGATETDPIIEQRVFHVDDTQRTQLLVHLIRENQWDQVLVFAGTQYATNRLAEKLQRAKIYATAFHGGLTQGARTQVMNEFKAHGWQVVVTTDLAARGIHIPKLPVVINFDLPRSATDYTHRIGRTGRAGESGLAVSFVSATSEAHFQLIEKRQGLSLPREVAAGFEPQQVAPVVNPTGGIKGKRPSKKDKLRAAASLGTRPS